MKPRQLLELVIEALNSSEKKYRGIENYYSVYNKEDFNFNGLDLVPKDGHEPEGKIRIYIDEERSQPVEIEDSFDGVVSFIKRAAESESRESFKYGQEILKRAYKDLLGITGNGLSL